MMMTARVRVRVSHPTMKRFIPFHLNGFKIFDEIGKRFQYYGANFREMMGFEADLISVQETTGMV